MFKIAIDLMGGDNAPEEPIKGIASFIKSNPSSDVFFYMIGQKDKILKNLDKEYLITCEEEEVDSLHNAIDYLNNKMAETKKNGSVIGSERIAVMTALNIANEMLENKRENQDYAFKIDSTLSRLQTKINDALDIKSQLDYG